MRLASKLALALVPVIALGFGLQLVLGARFEAAAYGAEARRDLGLLGHTLATAAAAGWRDRGPGAAHELLEALPGRGSGLEARLWIADDLRTSSLSQGSLARLRQGREVVREERSGSFPERIRVLVPVLVGGELVGAIDLSESLAAHGQALRARLARMGALGLSLVLACGLAALLVGRRVVGRPVEALMAKARRIGAGDFSRPLALRRGDELGELGREIDRMAERLAGARTQLEAEAEGRVQAIEQLRHADRLTTVGMLASGLAHELGTPLHVVSARAAMIETREVSEPDEVAENAAIIREQSQRMAGIVRQLLGFARRRSAEKKEGDLGELVCSTLALLEPLAEQRRVEVLLRSDHAPLPVRADASQIQQALANLVVNAIDATPSGGRVEVDLAHATPPRVPVAAPPRARWARVAVIDHGPGIPDELRSQIFDPFFTTKPVGTGTGLGLSVAWGIVEEHRGFIEVASRRGRGSRFSLWLPLEVGP